MMFNYWKILNYNWKYMRTVSIKTREPEYKSLETEKPSKISIRTKVNWGGSQEQDTEKNTIFFVHFQRKMKIFIAKNWKIDLKTVKTWKPRIPVLFNSQIPFCPELDFKARFILFQIKSVKLRGFGLHRCQ